MKQPGETLVIYTDRVTEAGNPEKAMFGDDIFRDLLGTLPSEHPEELVNGVQEMIARHAGEAPNQAISASFPCISRTIEIPHQPETTKIIYFRLS